MTKLIYDTCLLYKSKSFVILGLQLNNTLILVENLFATIEEDAIKTTNIMTKKYVYLVLKTLINFNGILIQLVPNDNILLS